MPLTPPDPELLESGRVALTLAGARRVLHPLWLRERCPCRTCRDVRTGQRLLDSWALPLNTAVTQVRAMGAIVEIVFDDGHTAPFSLWELEAAVAPPGPRGDDLVLWSADLAPLPEADWPVLAEDDAALHAMLEALRRHAFVLVRNLPVEMDAVGALAGRIGPMRITNWGGIADVKAVPDAYDLTMTTRALEPHTDNPYRDPVPGFIFLHCLVNNADGGDSMLTDGFRVAETLRRDDPDAFAVLTGLRLRYRYTDADTVLDNRGPLIELDADGRVCQVRLSNRTDAVDAEDADTLDRFYRSRHRFAALVNDPALQRHLKLGPGDVLVMDNRRLLHGRAAYRPGTGHRHMRQCYMDRDTVDSRRKVLARRFEPSGAPGS